MAKVFYMAKSQCTLSHAFLSGELEFSADQHMYRLDNIVDERLVVLEMHSKHLPET